jgi:hypothetical protein
VKELAKDADPKLSQNQLELFLDDKIEALVQFEPFPDYQIEAFATLVLDILSRHSYISPVWVTGHADITPHRVGNWKSDPGPLFPWKYLFEQYGIGAWYDQAEVNSMKNQFTPANDHDDIQWVQKQLHAYGYPVDITGELDPLTKHTLRVFMMHFRPENYPGRVDADKCIAPDYIESNYFRSTLDNSLDSEFYAILDSLVRRYVPKETLEEKGIVSLQEYLDNKASFSMKP